MPRHPSHTLDGKFIRIPRATKERLDASRPPGVELWKFAGEIAMIGLSIFERLRKDTNLQNLCDYKIAEILAPTVQERLRALEKK